MRGRIALQKSREPFPSPSLISHEVLSECDASAHRFWPTAAIFRVASALRFFRDEHLSSGSREAAAAIFADSAGDAQTYPAGTPGRVALPGPFREANYLPVSEARRIGFARPVCGLWRLVVALIPHCSLRQRPVVDVAFRPAAFEMRCNSLPARQNTKRLSRSRNEIVPERLSAVR